MIFIAVSCFVLFLLSVFEVLKVQSATWYLILLLAVLAAAQWTAAVLALNVRSDETGENTDMRKKDWALTFIPAMAGAAVLVVLYAALGKVPFFAIEGKNVLLSLLVLLGGTGLCYLFDYAYITATKKHTVQTTTVKIVKKEKAEKRAKQAGKEDEKEAKKLDPETAVFPDLVAIDKNSCSNRIRPCLRRR